jgi:hypothetical protein
MRRHVDMGHDAARPVEGQGLVADQVCAGEGDRQDNPRAGPVMDGDMLRSPGRTCAGQERISARTCVSQ